MKKALITGSGGLVGSAITKKLIKNGFFVYGIDINMRKKFFGVDGSVENSIKDLEGDGNYCHLTVDVRDRQNILDKFKEIKPHVIIHCASQPSHDWAATNPLLDFDVNCNGTLNLLEGVRLNCPESLFVFLSTSKCFGSKINDGKFIEYDTRWIPDETNPLKDGVDETFPIDQVNERSLFGASKLCADVMVQEYGVYYKIPTVNLRCGCITGPNHAGVEQHGFLSYLIKCHKHNKPYTIFGYKGKQVRDNIHTEDLADAIIEINNNILQLNPGDVFNMGGGINRSCSIIEAMNKLQELTGKGMKYSYRSDPRRGDHKYYVSNLYKFRSTFRNWGQKYTLDKTIEEIYKMA